MEHDLQLTTERNGVGAASRGARRIAKRMFALGAVLGATGLMMVASAKPASAYICTGGRSCTKAALNLQPGGCARPNDQVRRKNVWVGGSFNQRLYLVSVNPCNTAYASTGERGNRHNIFVRTSPNKNRANFNQDTLGLPVDSDGYLRYTRQVDRGKGAAFACGWTGKKWSCTGFY